MSSRKIENENREWLRNPHQNKNTWSFLTQNPYPQQNPISQNRCSLQHMVHSQENPYSVHVENAETKTKKSGRRETKRWEKLAAKSEPTHSIMSQRRQVIVWTVRPGHFGHSTLSTLWKRFDQIDVAGFHGLINCRPNFYTFAGKHTSTASHYSLLIAFLCFTKILPNFQHPLFHTLNIML